MTGSLEGTIFSNIPCWPASGGGPGPPAHGCAGNCVCCTQADNKDISVIFLVIYLFSYLLHDFSHFPIFFSYLSYLFLNLKFNCRVLLGGEIYYSATGRPWGPTSFKLSLGCGTVKFHCSTRSLHSSSSQAGREYSGPPSDT